MSYQWFNPQDSATSIWRNQVTAALAGTGHKSGCEASLVETATSLDIDVTSGTVTIQQEDCDVAAETLTLPPGQEYPRKDCIYAVRVAAGTAELRIAEGQPAPASGQVKAPYGPTANYPLVNQRELDNLLTKVPIAVIWVPAGATDPADLLGPASDHGVPPVLSAKEPVVETSTLDGGPYAPENHTHAEFHSRYTDDEARQAVHYSDIIVGGVADKNGLPPHDLGEPISISVGPVAEQPERPGNGKRIWHDTTNGEIWAIPAEGQGAPVCTSGAGTADSTFWTGDGGTTDPEPTIQRISSFESETYPSAWTIGTATNEFQRTTNAEDVLDLTYALTHPNGADYERIESYLGDGLPNYPAFPSRWRAYFKTDTTPAGTITLRWFHNPSAEQALQCQVDLSGDNIRLADVQSSSTANIFARIESGFSFSANQWYELDLLADDGTGPTGTVRGGRVVLNEYEPDGSRAEVAKDTGTFRDAVLDYGEGISLSATSSTPRLVFDHFHLIDLNA